MLICLVSEIPRAGGTGDGSIATRLGCCCGGSLSYSVVAYCDCPAGGAAVLAEANGFEIARVAEHPVEIIAAVPSRKTIRKVRMAHPFANVSLVR